MLDLSLFLTPIMFYISTNEHVMLLMFSSLLNKIVFVGSCNILCKFVLVVISQRDVLFLDFSSGQTRRPFRGMESLYHLTHVTVFGLKFI